MKKGFLDIEVSKLVKADWNYKEENEQQTENLLNNFKRNGQIENILIRELDTGYFDSIIKGFEVGAEKYGYNFSTVAHDFES